MQSRATPGLVLVGLLLATQATPAVAAMIQRVNKDKDKILLGLSQAEMAALEPGQQVIVEIDKPRFALAGQVEKINPLKKTAVIAFEDSDERFQPKQQVRFLSTFWNPESSPLITSYAQYHQYAHSGVEAGLGAFFEGTSEKAGGEKGFTQAYGDRIVAQGYAIVSPTWFGLGLGFERRDVSYDDQAVFDEAVTVTYNAIRPGFWVELQPHWRLGAKYDFTQIEEEYKTAIGQNFSYTFGQPEISVTYFDNQGEYGIDYINKDESTATYTQVFSTGGVNT